jgi:predicted TPR repeat methyltransferase
MKKQVTQATTTSPNLPRLLEVEADIKAGKLREAAVALDALAADSPLDFRVHLAGAMLGRAARSRKLEIVSLQQAVSAAPHSSRVRMELAKALSRHGRHAEAITAANKAVELGSGEIPMLEAAVAIADTAGNFASAQRHLQTALAIRPTDMPIRRALGRNLVKQGRHGEAEPHLRTVLATNPDDLPALEWLSFCLIELGRTDEAQMLLQRVQTLAPNQPSLPFYLALARGATPPSQPDGMVREIFDGYAHRFDAHLQGKLEYRVPQRLAEIIKSRPRGLDVDVLDLGCGTGLVGKYLGRVGGRLVGVDLSAQMIKRAARLGIYSELRESSLRDDLHRVRHASFDYVTAADVFIYVGDLSEVIPACFNALRPGGALIFSCETAEESEGSLVLRPSKRYAHSQDSVKGLCREAGFSICRIEPLDLRLERDVPISGFIAVAEK